jgi:hypothetical protein
MSMQHEDPMALTPQERAALDALPREADPGRLLEERTVQALREHGLLDGRSFSVRSRSRLLVAAGIAASIALFVTGLAVGQWIGTRSVAATMAEANHQTAMQAAAAVQRAGSAYVSALGALVQLADSSDAASVNQGREAALAALYAAVSELVVLAPTDPMSVAVHELLEPRSDTEGAGRSDIRNVVWF